MNLTTKIIAAITSTVVLALTGAIFYVAGQNSELREELSQKSTELTTSKQQLRTSKQQVETLSLIIDQAHNRMFDLKIDATKDRIMASRERQKLWSDLNYCEFDRDFIFRRYAPKRVQENMRKAMLARHDNKGYTEDPVPTHVIRD